MLIVGIVIGFVLSPWVLGRWNAQLYDHWFVGSGPGKAQLAQFDAQTAAMLAGMSGASPEAAQEKAQQRELQRQAIMQLQMQPAQQAHTQYLAGLRASLLLVMALIMILETLIDPAAPADAGPARYRGRLATIRYACLSAWLALLIAAPTTLLSVSPLFVILALLLALGFAIVPLGRNENPG
ncbi:MAG: hypothetical protein WD042_01005 [Phycisphaeraceae bacterium]